MALGDALAVALMEQQFLSQKILRFCIPRQSWFADVNGVTTDEKENEMAIVKEDLSMSSVVSCMTNLDLALQFSG